MKILALSTRRTIDGCAKFEYLGYEISLTTGFDFGTPTTCIYDKLKPSSAPLLTLRGAEILQLLEAVTWCENHAS